MRPRRLMSFAALAGCLIAGLMVGGCSKVSAEDPRLRPPRVQVIEAKATRANGRSFTGTVEARVQSDLGFRVGGKILERAVDVGERIKKGQVLMRLDSVDLTLAFAAQQAKVAAARARYSQAKADEARFAGVVETGVVSRQGHDAAKAELDISRAMLEAAEAEARVTHNSNEYAVLRADDDGVIVRTLGEPGQVVVAGQTVIQLAHDGPREAVINLPEGVRPALGTAASVRLYGQDQVSPARLRQLSDAADPDSRTFEANFVLEGDAALTPLGSTVTVAILTEQASSNRTLEVPIGSIHDRGSGAGVWIVNDKSEVTFRSIQVASIGKEEVIVAGGIEAGEKVVALGAHLLHEGQVVIPGIAPVPPNEKAVPHARH